MMTKRDNYRSGIAQVCEVASVKVGRAAVKLRINIGQVPAPGEAFIL